MANTVKTEFNIEVYDNAIAMYIDEFLSVNNIDPKDLKAGQWTACLMYINKHLFTKDQKQKLKIEPYDPGKLLHGNLCNNNAYDLDKINYIYDLYSYYSSFYNQRSSVYLFSKLTGIDFDCIQKWQNETEPRGKSSISGVKLYKKIINDEKEKMIDKLTTGGGNKMGEIAYMNNIFNWSTERKQEEVKHIAIPVSREQIARELGLELLENKTQ